MNKETIITILFVLVSMNMYTQQRLTIRDSLTQEPIAYTSVWFGNESGGYTDESGMIEIPEGTKQIRLSHICYETKNIAKVTPDLQTIFLVPRSINLNEVAINAKTPKRTKTTAQVSESCNLVPSLNMTLNEKENRTWNKKTFFGMDWMREQDEPIYQNESTRELYKGRIPCAKLGLKISK